MTVEELFLAFQREAMDANIDPDENYYWDSLAFGFAIAKGATRAMAFHLSLHWSNLHNNYMTMEQIVADYEPNIFDE